MKTTEKCANNFKETKSEEGRQWPQILVIIVSCLGPFTNGIFFAWSSPFVVKITQDKVNYDISEDEASYFTFIPAIAMAVTCYGYSKMSDVIGRKLTLLTVVVPHVASWILTAVARNAYVFYAARICAGLGDACVLTTCSTYIGEVASPKVRGTWGNGLTFALYAGQLFINVVGNYFSVKETAYICVTFPILFTVLFAFMPESPYFLIMKGRLDDAKDSLRRLRGKDDIEEDFQQLKADVERQISESGTWRDLFTIESNRKAVSAVSFLRISQQLSGMMVFSVYTQFIFEKSGSSISSATSTMTYAGLCLVLNFCAATSMDRLGRRKSYAASTLACSVALFLEAVYFFLEQFHPELNVSTLNWIPLAGMLLFLLFSSFGIAIIPTLMMGELFSASIKAKGITVISIVLCVFQLVSTNVFYLLTTNVGLFSPFLFFAVCSFVSGILSFYLVPETKGKTLEEIQQSLKKKVPLA